MTDPQPYTPLTVPPDTDQYVYRYVTKLSGTSTDGTPGNCGRADFARLRLASHDR